MHRGLYPLSDFQAFERRGGDTGPDEPQPVEKAIEHLAKAFPLHTPEWSAWSANRRRSRLEGTWSLVGHHPGRGPVYGELVITAKPGAPGEYDTEARYTYARTGEVVSRSGASAVYTGFQWRGRSTSIVGPRRAT